MSFNHNTFAYNQNPTILPSLNSSWDHMMLNSNLGARTAHSHSFHGTNIGFVMTVPFMNPPPSTPDRFVFGAEVQAHSRGLKMIPESIAANLPEELKGKIKETEWAEWMSVLDQDRKSHKCGDSMGCHFLACFSMVFAPYVFIRPYTRSKMMKKFIAQMNQELFEPRGMFMKQQEGFWAGAPRMQGHSQCAWFSISLNREESEKLKNEPKRIAMNQ